MNTAPVLFRNHRSRFIAVGLFLLLLSRWGLAEVPATVQKTTVPFDKVKQWIKADLFQPDFPVGDSNYHSLTSASDGKLHFVINTHNTRYGCRYYIFDPKTETVVLAGKLDEILGEPAASHVPQGKVHVPLFEDQGKMWFATHTAFYHGDLPEVDSGDRKPYRGGHFMNYDLQTGQFMDLGCPVPGEGIITLAMDKQKAMLYGLTWPSGILVTYDIAKKQMQNWGAVQGRGEWGQRPAKASGEPEGWDRICRTLGVDPVGGVYGSTMSGRIWKYDPAQYNPVRFLEGLDLARLPVAQSTQDTVQGNAENNWRVVEWNPATNSFWGILWDTTALFEFIPEKNYLRSLGELRVDAYRDMPRNPESSQLGFMIGPQNTLFYLANGPAVEMENRPAVQSSLYLLTYDIAQKRVVNHGPILARESDKDLRRVFFSESIAIGRDDHVYTVAWVEVCNPEKRKALAEARASGPAETSGMIYEMLLVRLPKWQQFVEGKKH